MLDGYINHSARKLCSIENFSSEIQKQELLLSNENKNETIAEEEEDELFDLYITPYSEKEGQRLRVRELSVNEDTTILKGSLRDEALHARCQEYEEELRRLKKIIVKKNKAIGDLTEELRIYYDRARKPNRNRKSVQLNNSGNSEHYQQPKLRDSKQNQCQNSKCKNQFAFFQKNNLQLYEEMTMYKSKAQNLERQLEKAMQETSKYRDLTQKLENEIKNVRNQNMRLLKSTKKYLNQGAQEIKIMSKMREVLAEKLSLKEMNILISEYNSKGTPPTSKVRSERKEKPQKLIPEIHEFEKYSRSVEKLPANKKGNNLRCCSSDGKKARL